jgi:hypothetical protein
MNNPKQQKLNTPPFLTFPHKSINPKYLKLYKFNQLREKNRGVTFNKWFPWTFLRAIKLEINRNGEDWKILWWFWWWKVMARWKRERKKVLVKFSKSTMSHKPPYYVIGLACYPPLDQSKSIMTNPSHWIKLLYNPLTTNYSDLLETLTRSVLAPRRTKLAKT